jgi:hypothetical protein
MSIGEISIARIDSGRSFPIPSRVTKICSKSCTNQHPKESAIPLRHHSIPPQLRISS